MFDVSPEGANLWFDVSNLVLLAGAVLVALGTYGTIKFSGIKEKFADERIAANEAETKRAIAESDVAKEGTAKANERIVELSTQAEQLRKGTADANARASEADARAKEAQLALERFKTPRTISAFDAEPFVRAMSQFKETVAAVYIMGEGTEPNALGGTIAILLKRAGWDVNSWNWTGAGSATGIIVFDEGGLGQRAAASDALVKAFMSINLISGQQEWRGDWKHFGGMLNGPTGLSPTAAPIRIVIGNKPQ